MEDTIIYLIRHAETIDEKGIRNTDETVQEINEKEILSFKGEQDSKLAFPEFKTRDGESANDTNKRMNEFISEMLEKYKGKELTITSPCLLKLTFRKNELVKF